MTDKQTQNQAQNSNMEKDPEDWGTGEVGPAGNRSVYSDRQPLPDPVRGHVLAAPTHDDLAALHQQILVGQFLAEVVELLHQHDAQALVVGQVLDDAADVLDDVRL